MLVLQNVHYLPPKLHIKLPLSTIAEDPSVESSINHDDPSDIRNSSDTRKTNSSSTSGLSTPPFYTKHIQKTDKNESLQILSKRQFLITQILLTNPKRKHLIYHLLQYLFIQVSIQILIIIL